MDENISKNEGLKAFAILGNVITWIILLLSLLLAFGSLFAGDAFGTGLYTELRERLITIAIMLFLTGPFITFISAVASIVLIIKKLFTIALWIEGIPIIWLSTAMFIMFLD